MRDQIEYVAVGWSRRPDGGNIFKDSRRHLRISTHTGTGVQTVCGLAIPQAVLMAHLANRVSLSERPAGFLRVTAQTDNEVAQQPACLRCYARAGRPVTSTQGREAIAQQIGAATGSRFTEALFEVEQLLKRDR